MWWALLSRLWMAIVYWAQGAWLTLQPILEHLYESTPWKGLTWFTGHIIMLIIADLVALILIGFFHRK